MYTLSSRQVFRISPAIAERRRLRTALRVSEFV